MIVNIEETGATTLPGDIDIESLASDVAAQGLKFVKAPREMQIDLWLCSQEEIRDLNCRYRDTDAVTDVLSFPNLELEGPASWPETFAADVIDPQTQTVCLGSIALCKQRAVEQAEKYGHPLRRELAFLIAHSVLHLCGYDHETGEEAAIMESMQEEILGELGITRESGPAE